MDENHNSPGHKNVYILVRVSGLMSDRIGMRLYVDPEQIKRNKELDFTETWPVIPGSRLAATN